MERIKGFWLASVWNPPQNVITLNKKDIHELVGDGVISMNVKATRWVVKCEVAK
jgi:hypothetical protein